jgi:hypothetical protein
MLTPVDVMQRYRVKFLHFLWRENLNFLRDFIMNLIYRFLVGTLTVQEISAIKNLI